MPTSVITNKIERLELVFYPSQYILKMSNEMQQCAVYILLHYHAI